ncbi:DUF952 domain-containing protein [Rhizorhapis suberifaciens]|uniref:Uncharacterized protein (DUF952 family) n=1 Tax=Rhizorhapis suberifaciens TaxID=13656 RepID=A0A840HW89_9SPHN|nr:DUF952 domain-containing protein [Rhizorhapis suberifaciens]MBB4641887.1 uncharacterized protein (DUF952 family) [Rhizorhapis suberifaciens]
MTELFAYKILTRDQWEAFRTDCVFSGAPADLAHGYIHLSAKSQTAETVAKHFAGQDDLILAMVDLAVLGDKVKWEVSRGGQLFPHLYGELPMSAVVTKAVLRLGSDGKHSFPAGFENK